MYSELVQRAAHDLRLSDSTLRVLDVLLQACAERGAARLTARAIAARAKLCERSVFRALNRLETGGYVRRTASATRAGMIIAVQAAA
jgi:Fe2+ or Zn2+ uptake regulation protein